MTIVPHPTSHQKNKTRSQKVLTEIPPKRGKASKSSNRILIIDSGDQGKWRKLEVFEGMQIYFAESVHEIMRSGFYQNFMFFAVAEKNAYVSKKNIKNLLKNRGISSSYVFDYSEASNIGKNSPENQLSKLEEKFLSQLDKSLSTPEETLSKAINFIRSK